jgi:hypothetical protein
MGVKLIKIVINISFLICSFLLLPTSVFSQISEGGLPPSFKYNDISLRSSIKTELVPLNFYVQDLREVDDWKSLNGLPKPIAQIIEVDYSIDNSGSWFTLPGNERIWRLRVKAEDALAVMLYYKDFYIPEGGMLFIYSTDKEQILGAYTNKTNPSGGIFATEFVGGDELILEYVESAGAKESPRIIIDQIGYGYDQSALREFCSITTRASSGSCEVNINCEEGEAWQNEKKSVCYMVQRIGNKSYICTGSLVNNTAKDYKPLIITARHCAYDGSKLASASDMNQWLFYFNREYTECSNNLVPASMKTMAGCEIAAWTNTVGQSDGMLLLLNQEIPEDYDVFYNGWDRSGSIPNSGVTIHHPEGDYKKISTYKNPGTVTTFNSIEFVGGKDAHLNVTFSKTANGHGVTEDGSSGSPLYNENKLVIGTLTGGNSSCIYTSDLNIYGRLYYHWDKYTSDSTCMAYWLDPLNTNVLTLQGQLRTVLKPAPVNLTAINQGNSIYLSWETPEDSETAPVVYYNIYKNNTKIGESTSLYYVDNEPLEGSSLYSVSAVYADNNESSFVSVSISHVEYKAPSDLKAERVTKSNVKLTWLTPEYEQTIYWGSLGIAHGLGFVNNKPFYFGQTWSSTEISPLSNHLLKAVQFIPISGNRYEIYISQGENVYRQSIESSSLTEKKLNIISLNTPFVLSGTKSLIVSIYVSTVGTDYPASCDEGSAVDGKGNIYSSDGVTWNKLYDESTPDKYNYNFIVSAIISSHKDNPVNVTTMSKNKSDIAIKPADNTLSIRTSSVQSNSAYTNTSLRSSQPAAFPEISYFLLYRSRSPYKRIDASLNTYVDNVILSNEFYHLSAFYSTNVESEKSNRADISVVDLRNINDSVDIFPTLFRNSVLIKGYEYTSHIEVVSISGKVCLNRTSPEQYMDTSSLSPGVYFFRIFGDNNKLLHVVKTIKVGN